MDEERHRGQLRTEPQQHGARDDHAGQQIAQVLFRAVGQHVIEHQLLDHGG
jgi:hypothetical protein